MAKKKQTTEQPAAEPAKPARTFNERQRAERVLVSQGRAKGLLDSLPTKLQKQFAEWCSDDGTVLPAATGVTAELRNYYAKMKAVVDEPPAETNGQQEE